MKWKCTECNAENSGDVMRCACGYEYDSTPANTQKDTSVLQLAAVEKETSTLTPIGILLLVLGTIGMAVALCINTSVLTSVGAINNLGLMNDKQNYIIISSVVLLVGVVFAVAGLMKNNTATLSGQAATSETMECPACAEVIKAKATVCRFCGYKIGINQQGEE